MISGQYRWDVPCYVTAITACVIATVDTVDAGRGVWIRTPTIHHKITSILLQYNTKLCIPYKRNVERAVDA